MGLDYCEVVRLEEPWEQWWVAENAANRTFGSRRLGPFDSHEHALDVAEAFDGQLRCDEAFWEVPT